MIGDEQSGAGGVLGAVTALDIDVKRTYRFERKMETIMSHLRGAPSDYEMWDRQVRNGEHSIPVRLFRPPGEGRHPLIVFFHGGGWVTGGHRELHRCVRRPGGCNR